jgi:transcriptional regulator
MYKLPYFTEQDQEEILAFMRQNSFAVVTGFDDEYPVATQLPLNIEIREGGKTFLTGHLMKNTDHHKAFEKNKNVLVVFTGPHCFISASWYDKPAGASTWNYVTVHAKGKINFTDEAGTYKAIKAITDKYEGTDTQASFGKIADEYIQRHIKAIVGFEIEVTNLDNVFKLSQNHDEETRKKIVTELNKRMDENSKMIAKEILSRLTD